MALQRRRGRPSDKGKIITYDTKRFYQDLKRELGKVTIELRNEVRKRATANAMALNLRKKKTVRLADGRKISDHDRKSAIIDSITYLQTRWTENYIAFNAYKTALAVGVGAVNLRDGGSYVGLYYEYGIGGKQDPSGYWIEELADENPFRRPGQASVTRSMYRPAGKRGVWRDLGGTVRLTKSQRGGNEDLVREYIGEDFEAEFWFRRAWQDVVGEGKFIQKYSEALSKINPLNYIVVRQEMFVLGRD